MVQRGSVVDGMVVYGSVVIQCWCSYDAYLFGVVGLVAVQMWCIRRLGQWWFTLGALVSLGTDMLWYLVQMCVWPDFCRFSFGSVMVNLVQGGSALG